MPVYNGEKYLAAAIRGFLDQTFSDFELIISDNASTDSTQRICESAAVEDDRIRYFRNNRNIGIEPNFNATFAHARGELFMWAAHDDLRDPTYLERCISKLDAEPSAVLCHSLTRIIDSEGNGLGVYDSNIWQSQNGGAAHRFASVIMTRHLCTDLFGLIRRDLMAHTQLLRDYYGSDRAFLAELSLLGELIQVPEPLFSNREHPGRGSRTVFRSAEPVSSLPMLALFKDYVRSVNTHIDDPAVRTQCSRLLRRWWFVDWNLARLGVDALARFFPGVLALVYNLKVRLYGTMPQLTTQPAAVKKPPAAAEPANLNTDSTRSRAYVPDAGTLPRNDGVMPR